MMTTETYTVRGAYSLATGQRLPSETHTRETLGVAKIIRRRTATWPSRVALYFDLTPWGGGYTRATNNGPGAGHIGDKLGTMVDLQTGRVYRDSRLADPAESTQG